MIEMNHVDYRLFPILKDKDMLCGNACLKALETCYTNIKIAPMELGRDMRWTAELACCLYRSGVEVGLHCWDSKLYKDYLMADYELINEFPGFAFLSEYECNVGKISLTRPKANNILSQLDNFPIIICVSSAIWHQDAERSGGHFVLLMGRNADCCLVADPGRGDIKLRQRKITDVIQAMISYGSWQIYCKISKNRQITGESRC